MTAVDRTPDETETVFSAADLQAALAHFYAQKADTAVAEMSARERSKADLVKVLRERVVTKEEMNAERSTARLLEWARRGEREKEIFRFPNELTTDLGRAINNGEPDWPQTLTGVPRQVYDFWNADLRPLGYRLRAQIVDFPDGLPGDIGFTISWG